MTEGLATTGYRSYLVRFWQSTEQGGWHASAQCVQTGNTVLFGDVASLFAFLQSEIGSDRARNMVFCAPNKQRAD